MKEEQKDSGKKTAASNPKNQPIKELFTKKPTVMTSKMTKRHTQAVPSRISIACTSFSYVSLCGSKKMLSER